MLWHVGAARPSCARAVLLCWCVLNTWTIFNHTTSITHAYVCSVRANTPSPGGLVNPHFGFWASPTLQFTCSRTG